MIKNDKPLCRKYRCQNFIAYLIGMITVGMTILTAISCEREPELHLHYGSEIEINVPIVEINLDVFWDYADTKRPTYNWRDEWYYGWDDKDQQLFGDIGYTKPSAFNIRRYYTGFDAYAPHKRVLADMIKEHSFSAVYDWGFWDLLAWNMVNSVDGIQSLLFDEQTTLESVTAYTNQTMNSARYQAPKYNRSFYQPELLYGAYTQAVEINKSLDGFAYDEKRGVWVKEMDMLLEPCTYIYLTQVIIHHNKGKITGVDGNANLSGMSRSVNINTGVAGNDPVTVHYNVRFKTNCSMQGERVDIAGGRLMTFGLCNINGNKRSSRANDGIRHYMDLKMLFNNGMDSTLVFDVTNQVQKRFKGGVITIELDADTIPLPKRSGGSGFDAIVKDFEDGGTQEFEM
ncbi:DUF5119 domain-containing protein [Prevotella brunnea]|nr:DUF5119 domain-containing protein [Prevotella brunnea]